jgi:hypothetical protein
MVAYLREEKGVDMGRTRVAEVITNEGLSWRTSRTVSSNGTESYVKDS